MSAEPAAFCARTDAVLALYLDGDIDGAADGSFEDSGFDLVCPDLLAEHLRDCDGCRTALQRARRLDAMLAENAGRSAKDETPAAGGRDRDRDRGDADRTGTAWADRVIAGALARFEAEPLEIELGYIEFGDIELGDGGRSPAEAVTAQPVTNDRQRAVLVPTLLLLVAFGGLGWLWQFAEAARDAVAVADRGSSADGLDTTGDATPDAMGSGSTAAAQDGVEPAAGEQPDARADSIAIADNAARRLRARLDRRRAAAAQSPELAELTPRQLAGRLSDPGLLARERLAAATALAAATRPGRPAAGAALDELLWTLAAGHGDVTGLADAALIVRREAHIRDYLDATLRRLANADPTTPLQTREMATLTVASRLGVDELDRAIRHVVRQHASAIEIVAAALRLPVRGPGGATLLLDCWSDVARRHELDDADTARELFAAQTRSTFREVTAELHAARSVDRRVRCLLALALSPERQVVGPLLTWATASCREEAYAAAWSLSQLPHAWLAEAARRAAADRSLFVLRTALARAGLPAAQPWLQPLRLTATERSLLHNAKYDAFPRLTQWFRDGPRRRRQTAGD